MIDQIIAESIAQRIHDEAWAGAAEGKCAHELFPDITDNEIARFVVAALTDQVVEAGGMWQAGLMDDETMIAGLQHGFIVALAIGLEFGKVMAAEEISDGLHVPDEYDGSDWN